MEGYGNNSLVKKLAACDKETRNKGVAVLTKWLALKQNVPEEDLLKIWKGLFFCMWHADKAPVQQELARSLSSILYKLDFGAALEFFRVFLITIRRDWIAIDRLRIDKFYFLIRMFLQDMLQVGAQKESPALAETMDCLVQNTLLARDKFDALGVNLHIADIILDELPLESSSSDLFFEVLRPFVSVLAHASDKRLLDRVQDTVFVKLGLAHRQSGVSTAAGRASEGSLQRVVDLIFELASSPETSGKNRKYLYGAHAALTKAIKVGRKKREEGPGSGEKPGASLRSSLGVEAATVEDEGARDEAGANGTKEEDDCGIGDDGGMLNGEENAQGSKELLLEGDLGGGGAGQEAAVDGEQKKKRRKKRKRKAGEGDGQESEPASLKLGEAAEFEFDVPQESQDFSLQGTPEFSASAVNGTTGDQKLESQFTKGPKASKKQSSKAAEETHDDGEQDFMSPPFEARGFRVPVGRSPVPTAGAAAAAAAAAPSKPDEEGQFFTPEKNIIQAFSQPFLSDNGQRMQEAGSGEDEEGEKGVASEPPKKRARRVRFVLSKNVAFAKDGPIPPPGIRTPAGTRPKGSALKKGVKPGPINMKRLKLMDDTSPSQMTTTGRKKALKALVDRKATPVKLVSFLE